MMAEMEDETQALEEAEEEGVAAELPAGETVEPEFEEEEHRLTLRQKIYVGVSLVLSFVFFSLLMFPRDLFLRAMLARFAGPVRIDFTSADPGLTEQTFQSFSLILPDGTTLLAGNVESTLHILDLIRGAADGNVILEKTDLATSSLALNWQKGEVTSSLTGISSDLPQMRGDLKLKLDQVTFTRLPPAAANIIPIRPEKIKIASLQLPISFRDGGFGLQNGLIVSNLFTIKVSTNARYQGPSLDNAVLEGQICLKPDRELEQKEPDVFGMYVFAGGAAGGELCFQLRGTAGHPQFNKL